MPAKPILLWLIDDTEANHVTATCTVATLPWVSLENFYSGAEAVAAFAKIEQQQGHAPDVILMDYYLNGERGDQITRALRSSERRFRPTIVGYSSVASASQVIVQAGADVVVRKHTDLRGINPSLALWLRGRA
jgi:CheY-like chemotaxis protein